MLYDTDLPTREFYVNNRLEFALWCDPSERDKKKILDSLYEGHDWKFMVWYCGWKVKSVRFSKDLMKVYITVTEKK